MKKYIVTIIETLRRSVDVEAENSHEAERIVEKRWKNGDYVLDAEDFYEAEFIAEEG